TDPRSRDLFEQPQPFRAETELKYSKSGGVPARPREAVDIARPNRVADPHEHDGYCAGRLLQRSQARASKGEHNVRRESEQFLGISAKAAGIAHCPAIIDAEVAAVDPAQVAQSLLKGSTPQSRLWIIGGERHQYAHAPHLFRLLRARRERPRGRRAAEQRDERAPPHVWTGKRKLSVPHRRRLQSCVRP